MQKRRIAMQNQPLTINKQSGAVLIVGLMMVLLITIVGLSAIRGSGLQEQMAGNMRDRNLAFQAAESALREGESFLTGVNLPNWDNQRGFYTADHVGGGGATFWDEYDWDGLGADFAHDIDKVSERPKYVVEEVSTLQPGQFGGAVDWSSMLETEEEIMYRVTARATGGTTDAVVMLQSTFK